MFGRYRFSTHFGLALALASGLLMTGCARDANVPTESGPKKVRVLCSFFPMYVFTKAVVGDRDNIEVSLMLPAELGCPHDYDLQPNDMKKIQAADLLVLNGGGLEEFAETQVKQANPDIVVIDSSIGVDAIKAGAEEEHDHSGHDHAAEHKDEAKKEDADHKHDHADHDHDEKAEHKHEEDDHDHAKDGHDHEGHDHDHGHHHHGGGNPHFFSSPTQAIRQAQNIADALTKADPAGAAVYAKNAEDFAKRLTTLADEFKSASGDFANRKIVTMHEVFDYLARDNGLEIVATIQSTPGEEPSPAEMRKVIDAIKESKAAAVFTEPQYPSEVAKTIAKDAGVPVYELDPIASGPADAKPTYYEDKMRENLDTLRKALSGK